MEIRVPSVLIRAEEEAQKFFGTNETRMEHGWTQIRRAEEMGHANGMGVAIVEGCYIGIEACFSDKPLRAALLEVTDS